MKRVLLVALIGTMALLQIAPRASAQEGDSAFVDQVMASLSVDERVGQLVMVNFVGDDVGPQSDIATLVRDYHVGAVLITASNGNIVNRDDTPAQIAALTNGLQQRAFEASARDTGEGQYFLPLFIATDNEGDGFPLTNVTHEYTQLPNNMTIGATWSKAQAQAVGEVVGRELSAAGINMLLGPVVDVLENPRSDAQGDIGIRSFGGNAAWVGQLGRAYVRGVHTGSEGRMLTVAKHFPGHGGSDRSTDNEVPSLLKPLDRLRTSDLAPFAELNRVDAGDPSGVTDAMMVSHIRFPNFTQPATSDLTGPITIDPVAFRTLMDLPEFASWRASHLVMADALGVPALKNWYEREEAETVFPSRRVVREALMAGNDMLPIVGFNLEADKPGWKDYQLPVMQDAIQYMRDQYATDAAFRNRADEAVRHVIAAKLKLYPDMTIEQVRVDAQRARDVAGTGEEQMRALSTAAITLIQPQTVGGLRARLPRGPLDLEKVLIVECWADCYPYRIASQSHLQEELLRLYGPEGNGRLKSEDVTTISFGDLDEWLKAPDDPAHDVTARAVGEARWIIFAMAEYNPNAFPASGAVRRFLDSPPVDVRNTNLIAIAFSGPYHLDSTEISKLTAYIAAYNKTDYAIEAAYRSLFGDLDPTGHSPVDVRGIFYSVPEVTQPDPAQDIALTVYGYDAAKVPDSGAVALVAGPVRDRNGNLVADGTTVSLTLTGAGGATHRATARTVDGVAAAALTTDGAGEYTASASVGDIAARPLTVVVEPGAAPPAEPQPADDSSSWSPLLLAAIGVPAGVAPLLVALLVVLWLRRRRTRLTRAESTAASATATSVDPAPPPPPKALNVDVDARRVYVKGVEARPPLSNEQFRLLSYLYERAGKVIGREELIRHVWPEAHSEGVSEEALDALVRRVRERIAQAGGERSYIVTLRGQGFRLEV
jgi:beta-N-acetylhexosaminidase